MEPKLVALLTNYISKKIKDIYVTGYTEARANFHFFSMMPWWYYIEFEGELLCLAVNNGADIQVFTCEEVRCNFEIEKEDIFTVSSIRKEMFSEMVGFELISSGKGSNIIALGFLLSNGDYIFFDALTWEGIKVGNESDRDKFLEDSRFYMHKFPK